MNAGDGGREASSTAPLPHILDFGMDTISLAGTLPAKLAAVRDAGFSQIMLSVLNTTLLSQGLTPGRIAVSMTQVPILAVVFLAGIYSIFKIPSLVGDIFSGAANAGSGVQQAVSGAVAAAIF